MNKILRQVLILAAVFIVGLFVFSKLMNHEIRVETKEMPEASLPVVYVMEDGQRVNELHGYTGDVNAASMRDTVTPVESGGTLSVEIDSYGREVKAVSFEVRSLDTTRLVQEAEAENLSSAADLATAEIPIGNLLSAEQEYLLILQVTTDGEPCRFYTRITQEGDSHIGECISFVKSFHEITMDKDRQSELASFMEPESGAENDTLQTVTIHNSLSQACWGDFVCQEVTEPVASVKEMNDSYNVILLNYILSSATEEGGQEYYNVEEYYRVRYGTEKMYLLSFERTVEEIFRGDSERVQKSALNLGIRSADVDFMANEAGTVVCFVQQGELWSYNMDSNYLTRVYSFRSSEGMDVRENYDEHDIRIIRANESGSIDFIVYGYMNRGDWEGQVGISVCHYDRTTNTVEEQLFIPSVDSYQIMKEEIGETMYISDTGIFYFVMGDELYQVDLATKESEVFLSGLTAGNSRSSQDGRYLAWTEGNAADAEVMHVTDLESGQTRDVNAGEGNRIRPLGFLGSDCVYGIAAAQNVSGQAGIFAMNQIVIADSTDEALSVLKTYDGGGYYVTGAEVKNGSIYLERAAWQNGVYVEAEPDMIRNRDMQEEAPVYLSETTQGAKQRQVILQFSNELPASPSLVIPQLVVPEKSTVLEMSGQFAGSDYYVYAKGRVLMATDHVTAAIASADENRGVVVDVNQNYVWKCTKKASGSLSVNEAGGNSAEAKALAVLLNYAGTGADVDALLRDGKSVYDILRETVTDRAVYNLTGCSLEQALYFVGEGSPVYAVQNGRAVILTGYSSSYVEIYDPGSGSTQSRALEPASAEFSASGNQYYAVGTGSGS